jgi:hypothetical protein
MHASSKLFVISWFNNKFISILLDDLVQSSKKDMIWIVQIGFLNLLRHLDQIQFLKIN